MTVTLTVDFYDEQAESSSRKAWRAEYGSGPGTKRYSF